MATATLYSAKSVLCEADVPPEEVLFGTSKRMEEVRQQVEAAVSTNLPLLIRGETGAGKETIAKFIHLKALGSRGSFVKVDCSASPTGLIERSLFTADGPKAGMNSSRSGRTFFLDDIAELGQLAQTQLIQVMEDSAVCRIEGQATNMLGARLISTTTHDIESAISSGSFRNDLFYRLGASCITMPPLRERREDVPALIDYLCAKYNRIFKRHTPSLSPSTIQVLSNYDWPGNIRELENVMRRYVIFGQENLVLLDVSGHSEFVLIPDFSTRSDLPLKSITRQVKRELERKLILRALEDNQWSRKKAASTLKISYRALLYKIRGSGIPSLRNLAAQRGDISVAQKASGPGGLRGAAGSPPSVK